MDSLGDAFSERFGFQVPDAFRFLAGENDVIEWPALPDFHWLTAPEVSAFQFLEHQWSGFVPFARSGAGDLWCWCSEQAMGDRIPVGFCPANCEEGEIYAPDFSSALFRLICDAAQHLSAEAPFVAAARALLRSAAELSLPMWPEAWKAWLAATAESPVSSWSAHGYVVSGIPSRAAYDRVLQDWIDDGEVGSIFRWMTTP